MFTCSDRHPLFVRSPAWRCSILQLHVQCFGDAVQSVAHSPTPSSNRGVPCADVPQNVTGHLLDVHFWSICLNRLFDFFEMGVLFRPFIPFRIFARVLTFGSVSLLFSRIPCSSQHATFAVFLNFLFVATRNSSQFVTVISVQSWARFQLLDQL